MKETARDVLSHTLAYLFNIYGLAELSPSVVSIYIYSQPLIASIMAIALQKDELSYEKIIAAIFIFTGVYLVSSKKSIKKIT